MAILLIIIAIIILSMTSQIKIDIKKLKITLPLGNKKILDNESKILLKIYILEKIKIAEIDLKKIDFNNPKAKNRINKIKSKVDLKKIKIDKDEKNVYKLIRDNNIKIENMNLIIQLGTEDAAITAIAVAGISSIVSILLRNKITNTKIQRYEILPIYKNKNILEINFDGIFKLNIVNSIYIICKFLIKRKVDKNDRTSNRRTYAYSNE